MSKNSILIFADLPILNPQEIIPYPKLSINYSVYLNTLLFSNWLDLLSEVHDQYDISVYLSEMDKDYLPKYILPNGSGTFFYKKEFISESLGNTLLSRDSITESKTLVLYFNSIGINNADIIRLFSLVQTDEPSIVVGKSRTQTINCVCAKQSDYEVFELLIKAKKKYDKYLELISEKDYFVHTIKNFLSIDDFEDIKKLYIELSKKESLSYCSKKMHESFNDLFIEYKELLNV